MRKEFFGWQLMVPVAQVAPDGCCQPSASLSAEVGWLQGVVVFLPSFAYADEVYAHWLLTGALASLSNKKHVFREPRSAVDVESTLR